MAEPGVELAGQGLALFGTIVAPQAMLAAQCGAGECSTSDIAVAAVPVLGKFSFLGGSKVRAAIRELKRAGDHLTIAGEIPTRLEAEKLIGLSGGRILRIERAHVPGTGHAFDHINYVTSSGARATVRVESVGRTFIR